jgi:hypothetical protein
LGEVGRGLIRVIISYTAANFEKHFVILKEHWDDVSEVEAQLHNSPSPSLRAYCLLEIIF